MDEVLFIMKYILIMKVSIFLLCMTIKLMDFVRESKVFTCLKDPIILGDKMKPKKKKTKLNCKSILKHDTAFAYNKNLYFTFLYYIGNEARFCSSINKNNLYKACNRTKSWSLKKETYEI